MWNFPSLVGLRVGFGVRAFDLNLCVQIDSIKQPTKSNSVGSGNVTHCRTSHLYDHLDHCFVVFEDVQHSFLTRSIRVWRNKINIIQIINLSKNFLSRWRCRQISLYVFILIRISVKNNNDQIPQVKRGYTVHPQTCIQQNDFWFCWAVRNWSLFLTHPADWNERVASENTVFPPEVDFGSSRSPAKSECWNSPNLHCFAMFPTWQRYLDSLVVMNVGDQTR